MFQITNSKQVKIMGVLNVTPDSFSDGGKFFELKKAIVHAREMISAGVDIIDVGGESSSPGSTLVAVDEELKRVIPVIKKLINHKSQILNLKRSVMISVDTYKSKVARAAIAAGARMVNDVTALRGDPHMAAVIAETGAPVILMYSKDKTARTTRLKKRYRDVVKTIKGFLEERIDCALKAGIKRSQIIIDPGMGAFVSGDPLYSYEILERLAEFKTLGLPLLVGVSRKGFLAGFIEDRLEPTLRANALAIQNGADIIRVHDVQEHVLKVPELLQL